MEYIWCGIREEENSQRIFKIDNYDCVKLIVCAVDNYQVFLDGVFSSYGPERTASGYIRKKEIDIKNVKHIEIKVISHNVPTFMCDMQLPFFGAELLDCNNNVVKSSRDFAAYIDESRIADMPRYSLQRGFVEKVDFSKSNYVQQDIYSVDAPIELSGIGDTCEYQIIDFVKSPEKIDYAFDEIEPIWWEKCVGKSLKTDSFDVDLDFLQKIKSKDYKVIEYSLPVEKTGFIKVNFNSLNKVDIFIAFEEIKVDNKWIFRRSQCNDFIEISSDKGNYTFISSEPYTMKYIRIIYSGDIDFTPQLVLYQNDSKIINRKFGDEKVQKIFDAAINTFRQNAVDIFTDCPGRERAGWLCDSYFSGQTEFFLTGKNLIERNFLENFILADTPEIEKNMLPMCFPSEHTGTFIPNWAMWFVLEIKEYYKRTGDTSIIELAKTKVNGLLEFFSKYENQFGLLENLPSWVFIEWSIANDSEYKKGINFPSNMLYSAMLEAIYELYGDVTLKEKADNIKKLINELSFNGLYYVDNAIAEDGKIIPFKEHISETCQYYALFFGITESQEFKERVKKELGPKMDEKITKIGKSNMFIGNYLRLFWLLKEKEFERVKEECIDYFYNMSDITGTLWENNKPTASCNHGFASVVAVILNTIFDK